MSGRRGSSVARALAALSVVTVVGALAAGCDPAGDDAPDATAPVTAPTGPGADGGVAEWAPHRGVPVDRALPFGEYRDAIDALSDGPALDVEAMRAGHDAVEASIATCMVAEGFEYEVRPFTEPQRDAAGWTPRDELRLPALPADRADVERVGYGRHDVAAEEARRSASEEPDANAAYLLTLTEEGQRAYQLALTGVHGPDDPHPDPSGGCAGRAQAAYPAPWESADPVGSQFAPLIREMFILVQRTLDADPRTVALNADWSSCMRQAGYDVEWPDVSRDTPESFGPEFAYSLAVVTPPGARPAWPDGWADRPADEIPAEQRYLVGSDVEIALALADYDCRGAMNYVEQLAGILASLEGDFVAEHRDELDALVVAAAGIG